MLMQLIRYFFPLSVDKVISQLTKTINRLETVAIEKEQAAQKALDKVLHLTEIANTAKAEIQRANVIKENLKGLLK